MSDLDFHREFLESAVDLVDAQLDRIDLEVLESTDPDSFGVFDRAEYLTGLGFAACQTYLAATIGRRVDHARALELGPMHVCGRPIAALVNAAANHWKHSPEWSLDAPSRQSQRTL